jgi:hypothetical protein
MHRFRYDNMEDGIGPALRTWSTTDCEPGKKAQMTLSGNSLLEASVHCGDGRLVYIVTGETLGADKIPCVFVCTEHGQI